MKIQIDEHTADLVAALADMLDRLEHVAPDHRWAVEDAARQAAAWRVVVGDILIGLALEQVKAERRVMTSVESDDLIAKLTGDTKK